MGKKKNLPHNLQFAFETIKLWPSLYNRIYCRPTSVFSAFFVAQDSKLNSIGFADHCVNIWAILPFAYNIRKHGAKSGQGCRRVLSRYRFNVQI